MRWCGKPAMRSKTFRIPHGGTHGANKEPLKFQGCGTPWGWMTFGKRPRSATILPEPPPNTTPTAHATCARNDNPMKKKLDEKTQKKLRKEKYRARERAHKAATQPKINCDPDDLWTTKQVSEFLGIDVRTVRQQAATGKLPYLKVAMGIKYHPIGSAVMLFNRKAVLMYKYFKENKEALKAWKALKKP